MADRPNLRDALIACLAERFFREPGQCGGHADALIAGPLAGLIASAEVRGAQGMREACLKAAIGTSYGPPSFWRLAEGLEAPAVLGARSNADAGSSRVARQRSSGRLVRDPRAAERRAEGEGRGQCRVASGSRPRMRSPTRP